MLLFPTFTLLKPLTFSEHSSRVGLLLWRSWFCGALSKARLLCLLLPCAISCSSTSTTKWLAEPERESVAWLQFRMYNGEDAILLASRESAASEVHGRVARARAVLVSTGDAPLERGLVIALGENDVPFFDSVEHYERALSRWGVEPHMRMEPDSGDEDSGEPLDFDQRLLYQLTTAVVPIDDVDLNLPIVLRERFTHVLITPSNALVESVLSQMLEAMLEARDIGWFKRQLMYTIADPEELMLEECIPGIRAAFVQAWGSMAGLSEAQLDAVRIEFGLREDTSLPQ